MAWLLVAVIVIANAAADVLQALELKRHGEVRFRGGGLGRAARQLVRKPFLALAIVALAVSFFTFIKLLSIADLSFAMPATAASFVVETVLAKAVLKERVDSKRWMGAVLVACGVALLAA